MQDSLRSLVNPEPFPILKKIPAILGWLIIGILPGLHAIKLMPQNVLEADLILGTGINCSETGI